MPAKLGTASHAHTATCFCIHRCEYRKTQDEFANSKYVFISNMYSHTFSCEKPVFAKTSQSAGLHAFNASAASRSSATPPPPHPRLCHPSTGEWAPQAAMLETAQHAWPSPAARRARVGVKVEGDGQVADDEEREHLARQEGRAGQGASSELVSREVRCERAVQ